MQWLLSFAPAPFLLICEVFFFLHLIMLVFYFFVSLFSSPLIIFCASLLLFFLTAAINGSILLLLFFIIRFFGGSIFNLRGWPLHENRDEFFFSFLFVCKYPPEMSYVCLTLGVDFGLLYLLSFANTDDLWTHIVLTFGTSPLAFYVSHFWLITSTALMVYLISGIPGIQLQYCIFVWLLILIIEQGICYWYGSFKASKKADSLWRLL